MRKFIVALCLVIASVTQAFCIQLDVLERKSLTENIICDVSADSYRKSDGTALTEEFVAALSSSEYSMQGLTADGNTRLILRVQTSKPGLVKFTLPATLTGAKLERMTDRTDISSSLSSGIRTVSTGTGIWQASAVMIAPESWPDNMNFPEDTFNVIANFTADDWSFETANVNLKLHAAPVVLIHGLWSSSSAAFGIGHAEGVWAKLNAMSFDIVPWNYDGTKGPGDVISGPSNGLIFTLRNLFSEMNQKGIACTRADFVVHSMGGLMARQFMRKDIDTGNQSAISYRQGMVRRIITIATPHRGSPWGNYFNGNLSMIGSMWQTWKAKSWWEGTIRSIIKIGAYIAKGSADSAMKDLAIKSNLIQTLGFPNVPMHSIYGCVKDDTDALASELKTVPGVIKVIENISWLPSSFVSMIQSALSWFEGEIKKAALDEFLNVFFDGDDHDLCVPDKSSHGDFPANASTEYKGLINYNHVSLCSQNIVGSRVAELLRGNLDSFSIIEGSPAITNTRIFQPGMNFTVRASDENESEYLVNDLDESMTFSMSEPSGEWFGDEEYILPSFQQVKVGGKMSEALTHDMFIKIDRNNGGSVVFKIAESGDNEFDLALWFKNSQPGIMNVSYFTLDGEKVHTSKPSELVIAPMLEDETKGLYAPVKSVFVNVSSDIAIDLLAVTDDGMYDVSAPAMGTEWKSSDSSVAIVTREGRLRGLKEGNVILTASFNGCSETINVEVGEYNGQSNQSEQTTNNNIPGSNGGGCNSGFGGILFAVLGSLAMLKNKK